jgi:hypothetical protein
MSNAEALSLSRRFSFEAMPLPTLSHAARSVRPVHPGLQPISAWISSVGAAVALADLDGDGLPNDVCYVDVRTDEVVVAPVPGTGARYHPFSLLPSGLPYEPSTMAPMGCLPGDFNEDGLRDLLVYFWGRTPIVYLNRDGGPPGASRYLPTEIYPRLERWFTNAATQADIDGDGHVDLVFGNYFPDGARILDHAATDRAEMQDSMSRAFNGGSKRFLLWSRSPSGSPRFIEATGILSDEVGHGWTLAMGAADLDGDGLPELYIANDFGPDRLLYNRSSPGKVAFDSLVGKGDFGTPRSKILGRDSFKGMGVDFGDVNGDGMLDIYVSNIAARYALEESHFIWLSTGDRTQMKKGIAPYRDGSESLGLSRSNWSWDCRLADFDNDGVLEAMQATGFVKGEHDRWPELQELATGNDQLLRRVPFWPRFQPGDDLSGGARNPFFVRGADGRYHDLAPALGVGTNAMSRGIAIADVDGDGDLDFATANQWDDSTFFLNRNEGTNGFLGLHLLRPTDETVPFSVREGHPDPAIRAFPAIGAEARATLPDGRLLVAQVDGGSGHSGKRSPEIHFGLGASRRADVVLRWRDCTGMKQTRLALAAGWHTVMLGRMP